jgi:DNA-nicking Smr family endonuclease
MTRRPAPRSLSAEERELWRRTAKGFRPLDDTRLKRLEDPAPTSVQPGVKPKPQTGPVKAGAVRRDLEPALKPPPDRSSDRRLRRGRFEVEARLDLHGLTRNKARRELLGFLRRAQANGLRQVLVITGKGAGARAQDRRKFEPWDPEAPNLPGVIRRSFTQWMAEPDFANLVSGYAEAHRRHGGSGAFYVMVRG